MERNYSNKKKKRWGSVHLLHKNPKARLIQNGANQQHLNQMIKREWKAVKIKKWVNYRLLHQSKGKIFLLILVNRKIVINYI